MDTNPQNLANTLVAFARNVDHDGERNIANLRGWALQNVNALEFCAIFAEAKTYAEELDDNEDLLERLEDLAASVFGDLFMV